MGGALATFYTVEWKTRTMHGEWLKNILMEVTEFVDTETDNCASAEALFYLLICQWIQFYIYLFHNNFEIIGNVEMY